VGIVVSDVAQRYRPFDGDRWTGRDLTMADGAYQVLAEDSFAAADQMAFVRQGRKAQVFKLRGPEGRLYALKVFFRGFSPVEMINYRLREFGHLDGLRVCQRRLIGAEEAAALGEPGLADAVLMPWIEGVAWAGVIEARRPLRPETGLALAGRAAHVLAGLEAVGLAHADISSTNVIIQTAPPVELIDVEDMYHERFGPVPHVPAGSPGYAHPRHEGESCRHRYGDRFAGAVLLAEMLTWSGTGSGRQATADISVFEPAEMGQRGPKFTRVHSGLAALSAALADLFERAWSSPSPAECPALSEWQAAIDALPAPAAEPVRADLAALTGSPPARVVGPVKSSFPGVPTHQGIGFIPLLDDGE
jgi:hypothetical protein